MIGLASLADAPITLTAQKYFRRRPVGPLLDALAHDGRPLRVRARLSADRDRAGSPARRDDRHSRNARRNGYPACCCSRRSRRERTIIEVEGELNERPYIALTVEMMRAFELHVRIAPDWRRFEIEPGQQAAPGERRAPARYRLGGIRTRRHGHPPLRRALSRAAEAAGRAARSSRGRVHGDRARDGTADDLRRATPRAIRVKHDGIELRGVRVDCRDIPDMLPILSTLGTFAKGETILENIAHVRLKESDRVAAMLQLNRMGGPLELHDDRLVAHGVSQLFGAQPLVLQRSPHPDVAGGRRVARRRSELADLSERVSHFVSALSRSDARHRRSDVDLRRARQRPSSGARPASADAQAGSRRAADARRAARSASRANGRSNSRSSKRAKAATRR